MKIVNINNEKINACFVFRVGNNEVSVSTIINKNRAEIVVFDGDKEVYTASDVSDAISWCNTFGRRD